MEMPGTVPAFLFIAERRCRRALQLDLPTAQASQAQWSTASRARSEGLTGFLKEHQEHFLQTVLASSSTLFWKAALLTTIPPAAHLNVILKIVSATGVLFTSAASDKGISKKRCKNWYNSGKITNTMAAIRTRCHGIRGSGGEEEPWKRIRNAFTWLSASPGRKQKSLRHRIATQMIADATSPKSIAKSEEHKSWPLGEIGL